MGSADFNPHSHAGSDFDETVEPLGLIDISIHTPTQGVTLDFMRRVEAKEIFQSTLPRRE